MPIQFSNKPGVYTPNTTVAFSALVNGVEVSCEISEEALSDHFGAAGHTGKDLVAAFEKHRAQVEAVARVKLPARAPLGRCLLVSTDF